MQPTYFTGKSDAELFSLFEQNPELRTAIISHFYTIHQAKLLRFITSTYKELDDDTCLEIIIKTFYKKFHDGILSERRKENPIQNTFAFLKTTAVNLCLTKLRELNEYRRSHVSLYHEKNNEETNMENPHILSLMVEKYEEYQTPVEQQTKLAELAICFLNENQYECVFLSKYQGRSYKDIQQLLNLSEGEVKGRIERGYQEVKDLLKPIGESFEVNIDLSESQLFICLQKLELIPEGQLEKWKSQLQNEHIFNYWKETVQAILMFFEVPARNLLFRYLKAKGFSDLPPGDRSETNRKIVDKSLAKMTTTLKRWQKLFEITKVL